MAFRPLFCLFLSGLLRQVSLYVTEILKVCMNEFGAFFLSFSLLQRGTCICAHAWIFFKLCIIMTQYIQTMKLYVLN